MQARSPLLNVMTGAVLKASRGLLRDFGEVENLQVSAKGPKDFVSAADLRAQQTLQRELSRARPRWGFLLEETSEIPAADGEHRWIIDPLDGTTNFLHGIPHFGISVGLERHGEMIAGVVYDPVRDEMFHAEKGQGAYLNDRRLRVSARRDLGQAVVATGVPPGELPRIRWHLAVQEAIIGRVVGLRRFGAAALDLAYVAAGRLDGFWEFGLSPWDIAAGMVIVREAGGSVTEFEGGRDPLGTGHVVASNEQLQAAFSRALRDAARDADAGQATESASAG